MKLSCADPIMAGFLPGNVSYRIADFPHRTSTLRLAPCSHAVRELAVLQCSPAAVSEPPCPVLDRHV
jgi:hypothetical protein